MAEFFKEGEPDSYKLKTALEAGEVRRYHAAVRVEPQTVGHHSWSVAMICQYLLDGEASAALLTAALMHDASELYTGDVPFTLKRDVPEMKHKLEQVEAWFEATCLPKYPNLLPLSDEERCVLKLADTLDGLYWCRFHERGDQIFQRWTTGLYQGLDKFHPVIRPRVAFNVHNFVRQLNKA